MIFLLGDLTVFVGHAPAGYLLATRLYKDGIKNHRLLTVITVAASLAPDLDLLYFYFIDNRAHNHHSYWPHIPLYWLGAYCLAIGIAFALNLPRFLSVASAVFAGTCTHLVLDTITGGIQWTYPLSNEYYTLVKIPAVYDWWVFNFIFHWTFLLEAILVITAGRHLFRKRLRKGIIAVGI